MRLPCGGGELKTVAGVKRFMKRFAVLIAMAAAGISGYQATQHGQRGGQREGVPPFPRDGEEKGAEHGDLERGVDKAQRRMPPALPHQDSQDHDQAGIRQKDKAQGSKGMHLPGLSEQGKDGEDEQSRPGKNHATQQLVPRFATDEPGAERQIQGGGCFRDDGVPVKPVSEAPPTPGK